MRSLCYLQTWTLRQTSTMLHTVEFVCSKTTKLSKVPSSKNKLETHSSIFATPILKSCRHALRVGTTGQVEKALAPGTAPIAASPLRRPKYPWLFKVRRHNRRMLVRAHETKSRDPVKCLQNFTARHNVIVEKTRAVSVDTRRYNICCRKRADS